MKKVLLLAAWLIALGTVAWCQQGHKVSESEVDSKHVKDFQRQVANPTHVVWYQIDKSNFRVDYIDEEGDSESMLFGNKGTETHYHIPAAHVPAFVTDTLKNDPTFKGYQLERLYARKVKNTVTYQARVVRKKGILWWKHVTAAKLVNFEVSGAFIDATDDIVSK